MRLITAAQARSMAETRWGRGGTNSERTNRRGAFYYSCSSHGGYVIDDRCLTGEERRAFCYHLPFGDALEIVDDATGKVVKFRGPEVYRAVSYRSHSQHADHPRIWFGEEDCDWALIEYFTGIRLLSALDRDPIPSLQLWHPEVLQ